MNLQELIVSGDALCGSGDLAALIHVVAEIESVATGLRHLELVTARAALERWALRAVERRTELGSALSRRRAGRGAVRAYGAVRTAGAMELRSSGAMEVRTTGAIGPCGVVNAGGAAATV